MAVDSKKRSSSMLLRSVSEEVAFELQKSKKQTEILIDELPLAFAWINGEGRIFRGNKFLAEIFGLNYEDLIHKSMRQIFSEEDWRVFTQYLVKSKTEGPQNFTTKVVNPMTSGEYDFLWSISIQKDKEAVQSSLFRIIGKDNSEINELKNQISTILVNIPKAVFLIDGKNCIGSQYSKKAEEVLGYKKLAGRPLDEVLTNSDQIKEPEILELLSQIKELPYGDQKDVDFFLKQCPSKIFLQKTNLEVKLTVHPVLKNGIVLEVLVVLEEE